MSDPEIEAALQQLEAEVDGETRALHDALAKAQGAFKPVTRSKNVTVKTRDGQSYQYAYAPLDEILKACRPALAENGLAIVQLLETNDDGQPALRTELLHAAGGLVGSSFPFVAPESPQQLGSLLTYLRRYAITALLGIAAEEDDEGQAAKHTPTARSSPKPTAAQKKAKAELLERLAELDPSVDWAGTANDIAGKPARELTREDADRVLDELRRSVGLLEEIAGEDIPFE